MPAHERHSARLAAGREADVALHLPVGDHPSQVPQEVHAPTPVSVPRAPGVAGGDARPRAQALPGHFGLTNDPPFCVGTARGRFQPELLRLEIRNVQVEEAPNLDLCRAVDDPVVIVGVHAATVDVSDGKLPTELGPLLSVETRGIPAAGVPLRSIIAIGSSIHADSKSGSVAR